MSSQHFPGDCRAAVCMRRTPVGGCPMDGCCGRSASVVQHPTNRTPPACTSIDSDASSRCSTRCCEPAVDRLPRFPSRHENALRSGVTGIPQRIFWRFAESEKLGEQKASSIPTLSDPRRLQSSSPAAAVPALPGTITPAFQSGKGRTRPVPVTPSGHRPVFQSQ